VPNNLASQAPEALLILHQMKLIFTFDSNPITNALTDIKQGKITNKTKEVKVKLM